jgi:hypothetical protein
MAAEIYIPNTRGRRRPLAARARARALARSQRDAAVARRGPPGGGDWDSEVRCGCRPPPARQCV